MGQKILVTKKSKYRGFYGWVTPAFETGHLAVMFQKGHEGEYVEASKAIKVREATAQWRDDAHQEGIRLRNGERAHMVHDDYATTLDMVRRQRGRAMAAETRAVTRMGAMQTVESRPSVSNRATEPVPRNPVQVAVEEDVEENKPVVEIPEAAGIAVETVAQGMIVDNEGTSREDEDKAWDVARQLDELAISAAHCIISTELAAYQQQ